MQEISGTHIVLKVNAQRSMEHFDMEHMFSSCTVTVLNMSSTLINQPAPKHNHNSSHILTLLREKEPI